MLGDLDDTFSFPLHIALTELKSNIIIFPNKLGTKVNKYVPLKGVFENNGWDVDLLTVKARGTGYTALGK